MAGLEMTAEDHLSRGSTPPKYLTDNPGKKWHELLDDEQLRNIIAEQVMVVTAQHRKALSGDSREARILDVQLNGFLAPNVVYLKEIGRLPKELEDFDPAEAFAVPEPTNCYFVTGKKDGRQVVSWGQDGSGWTTSRDEVHYEAFLDREGLMNSIDFAPQLGITEVFAHHVHIGRQLSGDEIRALRREQKAAEDAA